MHQTSASETAVFFFQHTPSTSTFLGRMNQAMSNAFDEHFDNEIDLAGSEGLQGVQGPVESIDYRY